MEMYWSIELLKMAAIVYDKEIPHPTKGTARKSYVLIKCRDNVKQEIFYSG